MSILFVFSLAILSYYASPALAVPANQVADLDSGDGRGTERSNGNVTLADEHRIFEQKMAEMMTDFHKSAFNNIVINPEFKATVQQIIKEFQAKRLECEAQNLSYYDEKLLVCRSCLWERCHEDETCRTICRGKLERVKMEKDLEDEKIKGEKRDSEIAKLQTDGKNRDSEITKLIAEEKRQNSNVIALTSVQQHFVLPGLRGGLSVLVTMVIVLMVAVIFLCMKMRKMKLEIDRKTQKPEADENAEKIPMVVDDTDSGTASSFCMYVPRDH